MGHSLVTNGNRLNEELKRVSFFDSLALEIATTQAQLDAIETERKKLKKKLKSLTMFLEEFNHASEIVEAENKEDLSDE